MFAGGHSWETALASTVRGLLAQSFICLQVQAMLAFKTCQGPHSPYIRGVILHISNTVLSACHTRHSILGFSVTLHDYIFGSTFGFISMERRLKHMPVVMCSLLRKCRSSTPLSCTSASQTSPRCCRALETTAFFTMSVVLTFQTISP